MKPNAGLLLGLGLLLGVLRASDDNELERQTAAVSCNLNFMRTYMLKGREASSKTDPLLFCSDVVHNCCLKVDQQRIFHTVKTVLPMRLNEHKDRLKIAFEKLMKLHRHILRTQSNFVGSEQRQRFCRRKRRDWENFNVENLSQRFEEYYNKFYEQSLEYYQRFYCAVCDGWNHSFLRKSGGRDGSWSVLLNQRACLDYMTENSREVEFWNVHLLNYLRLLQDVVDCTHYTQSFNLTFYNDRVQRQADQAVQCMNTWGADRMRVCGRICSSFSISNLIPWADGDSIFLTNTINFFERFYRNREVGDFISIEMRSYYKRFETLKTLTPVQENDFVRMIIQRTNPVIRRENPIQQLNAGLRRNALRGFRELVQQPPGAPALGPPESGLLPQLQLPGMEPPSFQPNDPSPFPTLASAMDGLGTGRRLLQGFDAKTKRLSPVRKPKAESDRDMWRTYEQIIVEKVETSQYVFKNFVEIIDLDGIEKIQAERDGFRLMKYGSTNFLMTETDFYKKLFTFRQRDKYVPALATLLGDFGKPFNARLNLCVDALYKIEKTNYKDEEAPSRRLKLRQVGVPKANAKSIKKT